MRRNGLGFKTEDRFRASGLVPISESGPYNLNMNEPGGIAVRQATISDLDLLAPLFDAYRQFYRKPGDLDLARRFLRERLAHNESIVFLAVRPDGSAVDSRSCFLASRRRPLRGFSSSTTCLCGQRPAGRERAPYCLPPRPASDAQLAPSV
jgi:hypothetical protein